MSMPSVMNLSMVLTSVMALRLRVIRRVSINVWMWSSIVALTDAVLTVMQSTFISLTGS